MSENYLFFFYAKDHKIMFHEAIFVNFLQSYKYIKTKLLSIVIGVANDLIGLFTLRLTPGYRRSKHRF